MKIVKKNVYYCEYCAKRGLSKSHMRIHEWHCTANPERFCRVCEQWDKSLIERFKARFTLSDHFSGDEFDSGPEKDVHWIGEPVTLEEILKATADCPACTLAILRQCGFNRHYFKFPEWDFKKSLHVYMQAKNDLGLSPYTY